MLSSCGAVAFPSHLLNTDLLYEADERCGRHPDDQDRCRLEEFGRIADRPSANPRHLNNMFEGFEYILNNQPEDMNTFGLVTISTLSTLINSSNPEVRVKSVELLGKAMDFKSDGVRHGALGGILLYAAQADSQWDLSRMNLVGYERLKHPELFSDDLIIKILERARGERQKDTKFYHEAARRFAFPLAVDGSRSPKFRERIIKFIASEKSIETMSMLELVAANKSTETPLKIMIIRILGDANAIFQLGHLLKEPSLDDETAVEAGKVVFASWKREPFYVFDDIQKTALGKLKSIAVREETNQRLREIAVESLIDFLGHEKRLDLLHPAMNALVEIATSDWTDRRLSRKITALFEERMVGGDSSSAPYILSQIAIHHTTEPQLRARIVNAFEEYFKSPKKDRLYGPIDSMTKMAISEATEPQLRRRIVRILGELMYPGDPYIAADALSKIAQNEITERDLRQTIIRMLKKRLSERNTSTMTAFQLCDSLKNVYKSEITEPELKRDISAWGSGLPPRLRFCWGIIKNFK
jgi:hypothetical protein